MRSLILLLVITSMVSAVDRNKGLGVSVGFGALYSGLGANVEYQIPLVPFLHVTPFASAGAAQPKYGTEPLRFGYCVGANAEIGGNHRFFVGPSFGSQYLDFDVDVNNNYSNLNLVVGPSLVAGYKGMAFFGLMWQAFLGIAYPVNNKNNNTNHPNSIAPAFGLGVGYKF